MYVWSGSGEEWGTSKWRVIEPLPLTRALLLGCPSSVLGAIAFPCCPGMVWGECHLDKVRRVSSVIHCHRQRAAARQIFAPFPVLSPGSQCLSRSVPAASGLLLNPKVEGVCVCKWGHWEL